MSIHEHVLSSFDAQFWERPYATAHTVLFCMTPAIGDALLATAVVAELHRRYPALRIVVCGQPMVEWIFRHHPAVAAFVPSGGEEEAHARSRADVLVDYTRLIARLPEYYNGIGLLEILANVAGVRLEEPEFFYQWETAEKAWAEQFLHSYGADRRCFGLQLHTPKDARRSYPHGRALVEELHARFPEAVLVHFGTHPLCGDELPWLIDCGRLGLSFRQQMALALYCDAFLTIDSAFFHVGRLLCRKPTLLVAGVTNPLLFASYGPPFAVVRHEALPCLNCYWRIPCRRECMEHLEPIKVAEALTLMLCEGIPPLPPLPVKELVLPAGKPWKPILLRALGTHRGGVRLRLYDPAGVLPPYAEQWNGVEVIRSPMSQPQPRVASGLAIVWEGTQFRHHSLAIVNRAQCLNIIRGTDAELTLVPYEADTVSPEEHPDYRLLAQHDSRRRGLPAAPQVWIRHQWPPNPTPPPAGARWIVMQPWEFGALPRKYLPVFEQADEIWTPSTVSRAAFIRSGVAPEKVQVIPNGIDPWRFRPAGERFPLPTQKRFRLLFVGGMIERKGVDILLSAYLRAFSPADDVCLVLKECGEAELYDSPLIRLIERLQRDPAVPEICHLRQRLTEDQMAALYRACTVFVSPYRGEGFSLPTLEAMACGLPVVVTAGGATDDFVDESVGWRIPAQRRPLGWSVNGLPTAGEAFVLEPDEAALAQLLRQLYEEPGLCVLKGILAAGRARTLWTWKRATLRLLTRLDVLCGTALARQAEERLPELVDGAILLARAEEALRAGQPQQAQVLYEQALADSDGMPAAYVLRAHLQLTLLALAEQDVARALHHWERGRAAVGDHPDVLYVASLLEAWQGRWEQSLQLLEQLLERWDLWRFDSVLGLEQKRLVRDAARARLMLGDVRGAIEQYEALLQQHPDDPELLMEAAAAAELLENTMQSAALLPSAVAIPCAAAEAPVPPTAPAPPAPELPQSGAR